jgi:hypothetical protein
MTIRQPEDPIAKAIVELASTVANCAHFLDRCGLKSGDAGLEKHVHYPYLIDPEQMVRPFVIIASPDGGDMSFLLDADATMRFDGQIVLGIGDSCDESQDGSAAMIDFMNLRWHIIKAIVDSNGVEDNTVFQRIQAVTSPERSDPEATGGDSQKPYYDQWFVLEIGPRA